MTKIARKTRPTEVTRPQLRTTLGKLAREEADRQLTLTLGLRNLVRENLREFVISAGAAALAAVLEEERTELDNGRPTGRLRGRESCRRGGTADALHALSRRCPGSLRAA